MEAQRDYPSDVHVVELDGREFILVGTAHVSRESADLVREVIEKERPDCVCIELDAQRFQALSQRRRWESLDLKQVIRQRQLAPLIANLVLASYQKKLGGALGVLPGTELMEAARVAEAHGIPVALCDRDVSHHASARLGVDDAVEQGEAARRAADEHGRPPRARRGGAAADPQPGRALGADARARRRAPAVKTTLIDERDSYLAHKILAADGERIVAVVGAGHVEGSAAPCSNAARRPRRDQRDPAGGGVVEVDRLGRARGDPRRARRDRRPQRRGGGRCEPLVLDRRERRADHDRRRHRARASGGDRGRVLGVAPVTGLIPVIGAGYVLAFLQAYLVPPVVREFEAISDDIASLRAWWRNRLLRVFLVFFLTTVGSLLGTCAGGAQIVSDLF